MSSRGNILSNYWRKSRKLGNSDYDVGNEIINTILNYYLSPIKSACKITVRRKNEPFAENS